MSSMTRLRMTAALAVGAALWCGQALGEAPAAPEPKPEPATARIQAAVARFHSAGARVGIVVRRMSDGREVFNQRGNELFEIASNTKLFTTAASLWRLGADYEFRTRIIANGKIDNGVLKGTLVAVGGGDPSLSGRAGGEPMRVPREMAAAVQRAGITEIAGDLVMDDRLFDRVHRAPGWPVAEGIWWYAAPISALSFNDNCAEFKVAGGPAVGSPAVVTSQPAATGMRIVNQVTTCSKDQRNEVEFKRDPAGGLLVTGRVGVGSSQSETIAVDEPAVYFGAALRAELEKLRVRVRGACRLAAEGDALTAEATEVFLYKSRLRDAIMVANRRSQNFYAEQIFKLIGSTRDGKGSFENGAAVVREFTTAAHLPESAASTCDGCGLSPDNKATAQAVCALLEVMYRSKFQEVFYASLATNGEAETTLRNRMAEKGMAGRIHAKTGTIKSGGISALSGYAQAPDGELYTFSILCNGFKPAAFGEARALEDAVCYAIVGLQKEAPKGK